jgi:hypothetical protein
MSGQSKTSPTIELRLHVTTRADSLSHHEVAAGVVVPGHVEVAASVVVEVDVGKVVCPVLDRIVADAVLACLETSNGRNSRQECNCGGVEKHHDCKRAKRKMVLLRLLISSNVQASPSYTSYLAKESWLHLPERACYLLTTILSFFSSAA